jgi:DNA-binding MarR family transcriptional regulator
MDIKYLQYLASIELSSVYCYRIILLLIIKAQTQAQLAAILNVKTQNILKYVKELESLNLIEVDRTEGRNKFLRAVTNLEKLNELIPGQTKLELNKKKKP